MNLQPLYDRIVVRQASAEERIGNTSILAPEASKERPRRGTVVAVGDGLLLQDGNQAKMPVSVGQEVIFNAYGGTEIDHFGEKYLIMSANDVLAVLV